MKRIKYIAYILIIITHIFYSCKKGDITHMVPKISFKIGEELVEIKGEKEAMNSRDTFRSGVYIQKVEQALPWKTFYCLGGVSENIFSTYSKGISLWIVTDSLKESSYHLISTNKRQPSTTSDLSDCLISTERHRYYSTRKGVPNTYINITITSCKNGLASGIFSGFVAEENNPPYMHEISEGTFSNVKIYY